MAVEGLIQRLNKVQDVFTSLEYDPIQLPQIVVVGTQSAGKSSVLESLVSRSFLPRGSGIVTRCPLVLQLVNCPLDSKMRKRFKGDDAPEEWGEFLHAEGKIYPIDEICQEIMDQQDVLAGANKGICNSAIRLRIYSPRVVDLTVVDLPGITKVPVGDQPHDIEDQIHSLLHEYIDNPLCIILAVVTANSDMTTMESLKLAKEVDPEGLRTLAVVTKIDLMDQGTDANDILSGKVIPVKLGIIGVVNRSQKDIMEHKTLEEAQKDERNFFETNYPHLAAKNGTPFLAKALHELLLGHIKKNLPNVQKKIDSEILACQSVLEVCGSVVTDNKRYLLSIISQFAANFRSFIEGGSRWISSNKFLGGAKICYILNVKLMNDFLAIEPKNAYNMEDVLIMIRNSNGPRPPFFMSECAFEGMIKPLIGKLLGPSLASLQLVKEEMIRVAEDSFPKELIRFPHLRQEIIVQVKKAIQESLPRTEGMIKDLVAVEVSHITYHRLDFLKDETIKNIVEVDEDDKPTIEELPFRKTKKIVEYNKGETGCFTFSTTPKKTVHFGSESGGFQTKDVDDYLFTMSKKDKKHIQIMGIMLSYYFKLVSESVQDTVAKSIMCFLVNNVKETLQSELFHEMCKEDQLEDLFSEDDNITYDRYESSKKLKALQEASQFLNGLADSR